MIHYHLISMDSLEDSAERAASNLLSRFSPAGVTLSCREVTFARIQKGMLERVESISQAQLVRVDFGKVIDVDNQVYQVYGPRPKEGLVQVYVIGVYRDPNEQFPLINYQNWEIKTDEGSTYPILSSTEAWQKLGGEGAAVVYFKPQEADLYRDYSPPKVEKVRIQEIYLAYFESQSPQKHLLPIFVFEGLAEVPNQKLWEVVVYLPAVADAWFEN